MIELNPLRPALALTLTLCVTACGDSTSAASDSVGETGQNEAEGVESNGDGDGDSTTNGDGDGDGDPTAGDGDGDPTAGDGDGDPTSGDGDGDPSGDGDGDPIKFDMGVVPDSDPVVIPGPGSCRPSEIYGAAGGFPVYADPAYEDFLERTIAVVSHNNWDPAPNNFSLSIVDISGDAPPPNLNYLAPIYHHPTWTKTNLGQIFGLTLDSDGNIYVAPTTVYGANGNSPGTIKKIDGVTGLISNFATLPNNGPALGNINYDCVSETIYAANHEDGRIYQIDMDGEIVSTYKHATADVTVGPANDAGEPNGQFIALGDRVWAVQSHAGRLYYSVWAEDTGRQNADSNEVWSVEYVDESGLIDPATQKLEFALPDYSGTYSNPVSDISLAATGWMLVSQRTMTGDSSTSAHQSTTYQYDYVDGTWVNQGTTYLVGELVGSASGGVDHDFEEGGYVWMTGDALDFYTPEVVYGLQGTPYGGGSIANSTLIDLDNEVTQQDKTVYGDVELPIPGDADPVPPPQ